MTKSFPVITEIGLVNWQRIIPKTTNRTLTQKEPQ